MMKNKNLKLICIIISIVILFVAALIILLYFNNIKFKEIDNNVYYVKYDNTWKLKSAEDDKIIFQNNDSIFTIQISKFDDEHKYANITELFDEIVYSIKEQNPSYKLLTSKKGTITKNSASGYKLLYENDDNQVMLWLYNEDDKLIVASYEAPNKYFDILLDSVNNILYNFNLKEEKYDLTSELDIKFSEIEYGTNEEIDKELTGVKSYEIANNNYQVNYSIPSSFALDSFDSGYGYFSTKKDYSSPSINLSAQVDKRNIYESIKYIYESVKYYRKDDGNNYKDYKEVISKFDSEYDSYVYKIDYTYTKAWDSNFKNVDRHEEKIYLFYALNTNHTFVIKLESSGTPITKKLINMIKINNVINYSSNVKIVKDGDYILGELKRFTDYNKNKVEITTLKVPDRFKEIDKNYGDNMYETRYYGYNYDEKLDVYDYEVKYRISTLSGSSYVDIYGSVKTTYGKAEKVVSRGEITLNNKKFKIYSGGYTDLGGILFTNSRKKYYKNITILAYKMPNDGYLYINIQGNDKKISRDLLTELTNFTIEEKEY